MDKKYWRDLGLQVGGAIACVLLLILTIKVVHVVKDYYAVKLLAWNLYHGDLGQYTVEIDEADYGQGFSRIVHLHDKSSELEITGHDYDNDGQWDRVFYCHYRNSAGCNSVSFGETGQMIWEPCGADKDQVSPFLMGEVMYAEQQLDDAMIRFHRPEYRYSKLQDWQDSHG